MIMKTPRISVLMPAYNSEKYIAAAIESILNQTFTDFEFIIINDGSTDDTAKIVDEYAKRDNRIKFVNNSKNKGLIGVLNEGLNLARGEYIARMDSDDISLPTRFERQIAYMELHPKCGVLGTWFQMFGNATNIVRHPKRINLLNLLRDQHVGHPTVMIRKSVIDKYGFRYDPDYKHAEDFELWSRMVMITEIHNLPEILLRYRWADTNISVVHSQTQQDVAKRVKQNILDKLSVDTDIQREIMHIHKRDIARRPIRKINIDDTQLLSVLRDLGTFSYMPNSGNMGDMLIASATMNWFDANKLKYVRTAPNEYPKNFVYGGGGAWIKNYTAGMKPVLGIMQHAERVVILPSSFNDVPELVKTLDERFVVFCREKKSYDYLTAQKTGAKILLDHDMALRMTRIPKSPKILWRHLKRTWRLWHEKMTLPKTVHLFRADSESLNIHKTDFDLSDAFKWFGPYTTRETIDFAARTMLKFVQHFDTIHTDRLHVAIAGILTRKNVFMYDNSYGKLSAVYEHSLEQIPDVYFETKENIKG